MFELTIKEKVYQFNFGMGFLRDINRCVSVPVDGMPSIKKNIGLRYSIAKLYDGDVEALVDVLFVANKGQDPRVTKDLLDEYIDDETTNTESAFEEVLTFLKTANATKMETKSVLKEIEAQKAKMEAAEEGN